MQKVCLVGFQDISPSYLNFPAVKNKNLDTHLVPDHMEVDSNLR